MEPLQRYVAEEIATDHAEGFLARREALRRLGLLGLGAGAATALLAACGSGEQTPTPVPVTATTTAGAPPGSAAAVPTTPITYPGQDGRTLRGAWAAAAEPRGAVLVIHENRGLTDHIRSVAGRFAGAGYSALAVDLLSDRGGTGAFPDPAEATAALTATPQDRLLADLRAGLDELSLRAPGKKLGATGFCFGGGLTWLLLATGTPGLAAATPFYGPFPDNGDLSGTKAAVLGIYAAQDNRVNASRPAAEAALRRAGLTYRIFTAPDANHAFFNDTGTRYQPVAAAEAWRQVTEWYGTRLG
ncbi:dienelactone hydrolase family protein [Nocardia sp. NPDC005366]|uniref:dienelactone hydrolase family protein n=1 Tax=Nocardia sp. NPDC005366 TaxID=3156878 RepID=UPI0033B22F32